MEQEANCSGARQQGGSGGKAHGAADGFSARIAAIWKSGSRRQQPEWQPERAAAVRGCAPACPGNAGADAPRTLDRPQAL